MMQATVVDDDACSDNIIALACGDACDRCFSGDNLLMRVRKKLRQQYGYPLSVGQRSGKKKVKRWGIQAVHTLPTGFSRSLTCSVSSSGSDDNDGDGDISDTVDKTTDSSDAASQSFRKCDVSFGNACFATGTVGFMLASCVINAIGLNSDTRPKQLGNTFSVKQTVAET